MGILRRIAGFLGFAKDDALESREDNEEDEDDQHDHVYREGRHLPRKGFSVPVQVPVDRGPVGPVLIPCNSGDGGVQGLRWYAKRLRVDEDGDVANEFIDEVKSTSEKPNTEDPRRPFPRFQLKYDTQAAKVRNQVMSINGRVQHCIEHQGRLQWI